MSDAPDRLSAEVREIMPEELQMPVVSKAVASEPPVEILSEETLAEARGLCREDLEDLASRLATERVKRLTQLADPFEAWEAARADILKELLVPRSR